MQGSLSTPWLHPMIALPLGSAGSGAGVLDPTLNTALVCALERDDLGLGCHDNLTFL